jgi:hypothetical protein
MVRTFEQNAKFYWRMWGPLGEPMIQATEQWANVQRSYIRSLRGAAGGIAPAVTGDAEVDERNTGAAEVSTVEAEEGSKPQPQAETTAAPDESSRKEIRNLVRESVTRSEEREVPRREATAATEGGTEVVEDSATEAEEGPGEEIRSAVRESVRRSKEGRGGEPQAGATAAPEESQADSGGLPIEEYDSLNVNEVTQRLGELSVEELERLRDYETENRNRRSLLERFDRRIRAAR